MTPAHINWLKKAALSIKTADGTFVDVWILEYVNDDAVLSMWAKHFRNHYCDDSVIDILASGTGYNREEYLNNIKFPDRKQAPGPSTRAGDFGEILLADFAEFILGYWCPREGRYEDRNNRNVPSNGCDVVGFKFEKTGSSGPQDELIIIESKSGMTSSKENRLQTAIDHSIKDRVREAMSLNAIKQRLMKIDLASAKRVERFQNENDRPFSRISMAGAVLDERAYQATDFATTTSSAHPNSERLKLLVIVGQSMMELVHKLYERAASEA